MWQPLPTPGDILGKADFHELRISTHRAVVCYGAKAVQDSHCHYATQPADQMPFGVGWIFKSGREEIENNPFIGLTCI